MKKFTLISIISLTLTMVSCTTDSDDCTETICPPGFSTCVETPCDIY